MSQLAHTFLPGTETISPPLVLLHGSDGTESDLMSLADSLMPGAARLGIRGTVATEGGFAFYQRFPDRRVDEADLVARVPVLAEYIATTCVDYNLTNPPVAIGFSNGAIMAAAMLMTHPDLFAGAILFRPLSPFTHDPSYHLDGTPVLIIDGSNDDRRLRGDGLRLAERLRSAGALVTPYVLPVGHAVTGEDRVIARDWLRQNFPAHDRQRS